jgi:hypothetical protein
MRSRIASTFVLLILLSGCPRETAPLRPAPTRFALHMDYEGAEALLRVLEQKSVTDADIDKLLAIRGVQAMVDNTTKYLSNDTREVFRAAVKEFVTTRKSTIGHFALDESYERADEIRDLIAELKADKNLAADVAQPVERYMPPMEHFTATVYGVTGGVSDGFVRDDVNEPAFYIALHRAEGDAHGVKLNITHELYHVMQRRARPRVPKDARTEERLLEAILEEGTATYVATPLMKTADPADFAEVDRLISGLHRGALTWEQASDVVFKGRDPGPYLVGCEMARALDRRYGPTRIAAFQQQPPAEFFRAYIELAPARFNRETEGIIDRLSMQ